MHLDLGDPWCRLPGVECRSAVPAPRAALCRHPMVHYAAPRNPFTFLPAPRCGLQTGPTPYIALANECTWAQALSAPKGLPAPCQQCTAPPCAWLSLACSASLPAPRTPWKSAGGLLQELDPLHRVSLSSGSVAMALRCCRMVTRYRYLSYRHPPRRRPSRFVLIRRTGGGEQGPPTESRTRIISSDFSPEVNLRGRFYPLSCRPFPISDKLIKMRPKVEK